MIIGIKHQEYSPLTSQPWQHLPSHWCQYTKAVCKVLHDNFKRSNWAAGAGPCAIDFPRADSALRNRHSRLLHEAKGKTTTSRVVGRVPEILTPRIHSSSPHSCLSYRKFPGVMVLACVAMLALVAVLVCVMSPSFFTLVCWEWLKDLRRCQSRQDCFFWELFGQGWLRLFGTLLIKPALVKVDLRSHKLPHIIVVISSPL